MKTDAGTELKLPSEYRSAKDLPSPSYSRDPSDPRWWNFYWDFFSPRPEEFITAHERSRKPWDRLGPTIRGTMRRLTLDVAQEREEQIRDEMGVQSSAGVTA